MSDSIFIKRSCERCPAVEEVALTLEDLKAGKGLKAAEGPPRWEIKSAGKVVVNYRQLCAACEAAVSKMILDISTPREKKTSLRTKAE